MQIKAVTTTTLAQCRKNFSGGDWYLLRAKFRNDSMSVSHDVGLFCIQWAANNRQGRLPVGVAWTEAACRACRAKTEAYTTVGKRAVTHRYKPLQHEAPVHLVLISSFVDELLSVIQNITVTLQFTCASDSLIRSFARYKFVTYLLT